jgi:hypothetical protein
MVGSIDPRLRDNPWDPLACKGRWRVWNSHRGKPSWPAVHQTASTGRTYGCMRSDQTIEKLLRHGGRPHMGPCVRRDDIRVSFRFNFQTADMRPHCRGARRPSFASVAALKEKEGAGKTGCALHPRSRAQLHIKKHAHEHTGSAEAVRPSLRSGFKAYSALSPVTGLSCHRRLREVVLPANLTPASGRQDHTASPSATPALVSRKLRVHRIPPRVRDDRDPPLSPGETGGFKSLICPAREAEYFRFRGLTLVSENQK